MTMSSLGGGLTFPVGRVCWLVLSTISAIVGCDSDGDAVLPAADAGPATGATTAGGGGGGTATGDGAVSGGAATGGGTATGSATAAGGTVTAGSGTSTGGGIATGSATATGGTTTTGSGTVSGGTSTGGNAATGDEAATGADTGAGGAGGAPGEAAATGGTEAAGGQVQVGECSRPVGSCSSPQVTVTSVDLGVSIERSAGDSDTEPIPLAIASMPSGGSRLAALSGSSVHIAELDCDDQLVGSPFSIPAVDLQDIIADDAGGVVLVTRDATNGGTDNCGNGQLCGGTSSPCRTMWMVRFNSTGDVEWETEVTNLSSSGLAGYTSGARFIWWYQHHGRLAFSGTTYAAFFGVAITTDGGGCVDIHQGDRIQMVSSSGQLVSDGSLAVGMSHAWTSRILWDPRTSEFMASDATDDNCRIANPNGGQTILPGSCDGTLFNGDIVMSTNGGYWNASSQGGTIRLVHTTGGDGDQQIHAGSSRHPHLVSYGENNMLLTWGSGGGQAAQVRNAGDGSVMSEFTIDVADEPYHAYKAYDDGSVAFPALGGGSRTEIARVMPCD